MICWSPRWHAPLLSWTAEGDGGKGWFPWGLPGPVVITRRFGGKLEVMKVGYMKRNSVSVTLTCLRTFCVGHWVLPNSPPNFRRNLETPNLIRTVSIFFSEMDMDSAFKKRSAFFHGVRCKLVVIHAEDHMTRRAPNWFAQWQITGFRQLLLASSSFFHQVQQSMVFFFLVLGRFIFCCWSFEAFFKKILPSMNFLKYVIFLGYAQHRNHPSIFRLILSHCQPVRLLKFLVDNPLHLLKGC